MHQGERWQGTVTRLPEERPRRCALLTPGGRTGYRVALAGERPLATPAVDRGRVYLGGGFGSREFYCLDAGSGEAIWALRTSDDGPTAAVVCEGKVAFNTESCTLFVVDADTGEHVWSAWLGDPLMSQPAAHDGAVCTAYPHADGQHRLAAFGLHDGALRWEQPIGGDVISAPVIHRGAVYVTTFDGTVSRFRLRDGARLWDQPVRATSAPWVDGDAVHVSRRAGEAGAPPEEGFSSLAVGGWVKSAMRAASEAAYLVGEVQARSAYGAASLHSDTLVGFGHGAPAHAKTAAAATHVGHGTVRGLWEYQGSRPLVVGERTFATKGTALTATDARSGAELWTIPLPGNQQYLGGHLGSPPAYAAGRLVLGTATGEVLVVDAASGEVVVRDSLREQIRFQPALVGGWAYFGTVSGTLVALDLGDPSLDGWTMWGGGPCHNGPSRAAAQARAA